MTEIADIPDAAGCETYFAKPQHIFPHLEDGKIPTEQFINACQGIAEFVEFLGRAFTLVKNDIQGNVVKVRARYETNKEGQKYLQNLIDADLADHGGKFGIATEGLLWLKRGLQFMLEMLTLMVFEYRSNVDRSKTDNLTSVVDRAYKKSLKRHHGFLAKQAFAVLSHAVPYRHTILKAVALGKPGLDEVCIRHIEAHLDTFRKNVDVLANYYVEKGLETPEP